MAERPTITIPDSEPPADLVIEDETDRRRRRGRRRQACLRALRRRCVEQRTGVRCQLEPRRPVRFRLGAREVIEGWDTGVAGMRVGGRRRLTIPPHLGYGSRGAGGVIKGGETLVFVVDLVNVR